VAFSGNEFAGYVTLKWQSDYKNFAKDKTPEISDLNVLPGYRNKGMGTALIEICEKYAAERSNVVGIGVGLYPDYGSAQRLYIKRGYIPDGHGATYNYEYVTPGKEYPLDDDLVLWFTKKLN
jgi:GNAT superfamily N-acetyltransferase